MQAMAVMAAMAKTPGNAAQAAGKGGEDAAAEGDFAALLTAQIGDGKGSVLEAEALLDGQALEPVLADVAAQQAPAVLPDPNAVTSDSLLSLAGIVMPLYPAVAPQAAPAGLLVPASGKRLEGVQAGAEMAARLDAEHPGANPAALDSGPVAEFAVDGKLLPQNRLESNVDGLNFPLLSSESRHMPEVPLAAQSALMAASHAAVAEGKPLTVSPSALQAPVGSPAWGDGLGQKVVWMAGQQVQVAELHLNPPHLGPMEVRLSVSGDQVSALFVSAQPAVREAIEAAMPRLREMFADGGMTLGNATVGSDSLSQQQPGREGQANSSRQPDFPDMGGLRPPPGGGGVISLRQDGSGMVDLFA